MKNLKIVGLFLLALCLVSCRSSLKSGGAVLRFSQDGETYTVEISTGNRAWARAGQPAGIYIQPEGGEEPTRRLYAKGYDKVSRRGDNITAEARIETENGSSFRIEDRYHILQEGVFGMDRTVTVLHEGTGDAGFASHASFPMDGTGFEYFIPSILYKDTAHVRPSAIAADLDVDQMYVKETRSALPLAMARSTGNGTTLALLHHHPAISSSGFPGGGSPGEISGALQYGSIGFSMPPSLSLDFTWPSLEGPRNYEPKNRPDKEVWIGRFHPVEEGFSHAYSLALIPMETPGYNEAMTRCFSTAYTLENPPVTNIDMAAIYDQHIELFNAEYRSYGKGARKAAGLPWSLDLPDGTNREGVSFQMGFVGQQTSVGYHMYRYGWEHGDEEIKEKGRTILDFWTSPSIMDSYFPVVWWDPADNATLGRSRGYPSFLRCMVDGMEGLLDACRCAAAYGDPQPVWDRELRRVAENLVRKQNADGSFVRAWETDGSVHPGWDRNTFGASPLNTPEAVRFLVRMYEYTGEDLYREAALKAAEYSYNVLYQTLGKYVGGTPDNPNTVDKEAAIYALYAFNAAHELTGDEKYLKAAEHAALNAMSWVYCYDFPVPNINPEDDAKNPFMKGGTLGFSLIATGHSAADVYISCLFYELYKLYVKTGNEQYRDMALFVENDTKQSADYDGRLHYKYRAFMTEATNIANLGYWSVNLWLPWCSIVTIDPILRLKDTFGVMNIEDISLPMSTLRERLASEGSGGRPLRSCQNN